jgi:hypothetical protein
MPRAPHALVQEFGIKPLWHLEKGTLENFFAAVQDIRRELTLQPPTTASSSRSLSRRPLSSARPVHVHGHEHGTSDGDDDFGDDGHGDDARRHRRDARSDGNESTGDDRRSGRHSVTREGNGAASDRSSVDDRADGDGDGDDASSRDHVEGRT